MKEGDKVNVTDQKTNADLEAGIDSTKREFASDGFSETKADSRDDKGDNSRTGRDSGHQNSVFAAISNFFNAILTWVAAPFLVILGLITGNSSAIDSADNINTVGSSPDNEKDTRSNSRIFDRGVQEQAAKTEKGGQEENKPDAVNDPSKESPGGVIDPTILNTISKNMAEHKVEASPTTTDGLTSPDPMRAAGTVQSGEISK